MPAMRVMDNPTWNMDRPRERPYGSVRTIPSMRDSQPLHHQTPQEFRVRVHDHAEHQFEPPSPLPEKVVPFQPKRHRYIPIATPLIMIATIVLFVLMMYSNDCPAHIGDGKSCVGKWLKSLSFQPWLENPSLGPQRKYLLRWGGLEGYRVVHRGEGWRLLSAIAVNGGVLQLVINLLALLVVGVRMEFVFWFWKVMAVYVVSGFGGSVLSALLIRTQVFAGASGAIMGLIGASVADLINNWHVTGRRFLKTADLLLFALLSVGFGLMPQVDNFANAGGLFTGFLLGFVLLQRPQLGFKDTRHLTQMEAYEVNNEHSDYPPVGMYRKSQRVLRALALILLVGLLAAGCVVLFLDLKFYKRCHWCHYFACVPHIKWTCPGPYV